MKIVNWFQRKNVYGWGMAFLLFSIISGSAIQAYAAEEQAEETTVAYIYHRHIGSSTEEGGCYKQPVYHIHVGDESNGGECYEIPVYHSHTGNEADGGACYTTAIYHQHEGDGSAAEGCYVASYHTHNDDCYEEVDDDEYGCYVVRYWDTSDGDYEGHDYKYYEMSCGRTIHGTNSAHYHTVLHCGRGSEVTGYQLGCGKTQESIDGYQLSCEKTQEDIDGYQLSCIKTGESIDSYARNCGKEEELPYGAIIITKQIVDETGAIAFVEVEDYTAGELQLSQTPFQWFDEQGNSIGSGDSIAISVNGTYRVRADILNEDVNEDSLWAQVNVTHIREQQPEKEEEREDEDSDDDSKEDTSTGTDEGNSTAALPSPSLLPTPMPVLTIAPAATPRETKRTGTGSGQKEKTDEGTSYSIEKELQEQEKISPKPKRKTKTTVGKATEKQSRMMPVEEPKEMQKAGFWASPAAKVLLLTTGTFILLTGLFLIGYLFRQSVRIYNDDGTGQMHYLGRCMVQLTEEGYLIVLSASMTEKALTNRYVIKPGLFRFGRGKEEEVLVEKQEKRLSVPLEKEMTVVI